MGGGAALTIEPGELILAARKAAEAAYAPYSKFPVGAALAFADGSIVAGANVENASYGLSLCAETVAAAAAMNKGMRGGLVGVAIAGPTAAPVTPCGRCRHVLNELAQLGATDPTIWCAGGDEIIELKLSDLLPRAFGPASLG